MIKRTRIRFILIAMTATLLVTVLLIVAINVAQTLQTNHNLDQVLQEMGRLPENWELNRKKAETDEDIIIPGKEQRGSAVNQYAGRYFQADITEDGEIKTNRFFQELLTEEEISDLVQAILQTGKDTGYMDGYRFLVKKEAPGTRICFLDCTTELHALQRLWMISAGVGFAGLLISFVLIYLGSGRIVRPLQESMEKQKRFISDAGHELKTPLSVIGTNMDILSMDFGENEWVEGTKKQVHKMGDLVSQLIALAKMDEAAAVADVQKFNISSAASESVDLFLGKARLSGHEIRQEIQEELYVWADENMVQQLFVILVDNAVKYAAGQDPVWIRLQQEGRKIVFETINSWDRTNAPEDLNRFFDRFYRSDASRDRSSGKGGFGLGLSIAKSIAEKNHIQLTASEDKMHRVVMRAVFQENARH